MWFHLFVLGGHTWGATLSFLLNIHFHLIKSLLGAFSALRSSPEWAQAKVGTSGRSVTWRGCIWSLVPTVSLRGPEELSQAECRGVAGSGRRGVLIPQECLQVETASLCQRLRSAQLHLNEGGVLGLQVARASRLRLPILLPVAPSADLW